MPRAKVIDVELARKAKEALDEQRDHRLCLILPRYGGQFVKHVGCLVQSQPG